MSEAAFITPEEVALLDGPWPLDPIKGYPCCLAGSFSGLLLHVAHPQAEPFPVVGITWAWLQIRVKVEPSVRAYCPPLLMEVMN